MAINLLRLMIFRPCIPKELPQLIDLQEEIFASLPDESLLRRNSTEMLQSCLSAPHTTLGAWDGERLIAAAILYRPQEECENLERLLSGIPPLEEEATANYKLIMVRSAYRGKHLQVAMGIRLEEIARQAGVKRLCITVAPHNTASRTNIQRQGFQYNRTLQKYGFPRELWYKEL